MKTRHWCLISIFLVLIIISLCYRAFVVDQGTGPLPGNDCKISVAPTLGGPSFDTDFLFDGDPSGSDYKLYLTPTNGDIVVGGKPALDGVMYTLWLKSLASSARSVALENGSQQTPVNFTYAPNDPPWFPQFSVHAQDEDGNKEIELYARYGKHGVKIMVTE